MSNVHVTCSQVYTISINAHTLNILLSDNILNNLIQTVFVQLTVVGYKQ